MTALARLLWAVAGVLVFAFALLAVNQGRVALRFLGWETPEISVFWWLLLAFLLGAATTAILFTVTALRHRMRQRHLNRELQATRRELERLRGAAPAAPPASSPGARSATR